MLLKRLDNSKQLRKRQVQALFHLPTLTRESVSELHTLLEGFERVVKNLDQVVEPEDYKNLLLVHILTARLDPVTRRGWEEFSSTKEQDTLSDLTDFIRRRVQVLESLPSKSVDSRGPQQYSKLRPASTKASYSSVHGSEARCVACKGDHPLYQCPVFQRQEVAERDALLRTHSLCRNCFRVGHQAKDCKSRFSCRTCKGRHHTLVCFKIDREGSTKVTVVARGNHQQHSKETRSSASSSTQTANVSTKAVCSAQQYSSQVLLATAVVILVDDSGQRFPARALLDSGSESNFVSERLSQRMNVNRERVDISVLGIGQAATQVKHRIRAMVQSRVSEYCRDMDFLVLSKVTVNLPTLTVNTKGWSIPKGIELADPAFFQSKGVDIVLGIEAFLEFFGTGGKISLGARLPALNESVFGWVVCGGLSVPSQSIQVNCNISASGSLESLIARFWECEEIGSTNHYSPEEVQCEEHFKRTVKREMDGRYTVALPKDDGVLSRLGKSEEIALRRLQGTERRLSRDSNLRDQYLAFMQEYLRLGHMLKVEKVSGEVQRCYLPHQPVVKEASTTTKLRVVFDASCKTSTGVSLNDGLLVGPVI
ncbi:uncharacterized protein LOC129777550 [Toxorhynchites rutilus septentrionalis]|uniref:uncharacterized protein LOC129777550 n=1 Tax=Toxorhynchites rutilus septentrionalis TaxID=329112 RepID=UPI002478D379|nr:uncharacterized protein LOC129777550 [Toxorhynchites rutilus septentrionalis]XP_055639849.1 uncharacterized protein LOC129777550 [Toxorhynchites rutilus septentrionalis]XP_055639850.1 uncharacterized protein LOC129777550 [Toxorhynchites rutilus septentrionalis]XP_055639851.1 uncharacterized protein LOC129777550 [Toxorhynchites rutilus septentrionalis]